MIALRKGDDDREREIHHPGVELPGCRCVVTRIECRNDNKPDRYSSPRIVITETLGLCK
jgi:hypothetical protein